MFFQITFSLHVFVILQASQMLVLDYWTTSLDDGAYIIGVEHSHPTFGRVVDLYTSDKPENQFLLSLPNVAA